MNIPRGIQYSNRDQKQANMVLQTKGIHFIIDRHKIDIDYSRLDTQPTSAKNPVIYQLTSDGVCIYYRGDQIYNLIRNYTRSTMSKSILPSIPDASMASTPRANMRRESNSKPAVSEKSGHTPRQVHETTPIHMMKGNHQELLTNSITVGKPLSDDHLLTNSITVGKPLSDDYFGKGDGRSETRPPTLPVVQAPSTSKTKDASIPLKDQPPMSYLPLVMKSGGSKSNDAGIVFPNSPATPAVTLSSKESSSSNKLLKLPRPLEAASPSFENQKENVPILSTPQNSGYFNIFSRPSLTSQSVVSARAEGIRNLGNTCYLNAVLEALLSLRGFSSDMTGLLWRSIRKFRFMRLHTDKTTFDTSCMTQLANIIK